MSQDMLKRESEIRAALYRPYPMRSGGVARWAAAREAKRKKAAERRQRFLDRERKASNS